MPPADGMPLRITDHPVFLREFPARRRTSDSDGAPDIRRVDHPATLRDLDATRVHQASGRATRPLHQRTPVVGTHPPGHLGGADARRRSPFREQLQHTGLELPVDGPDTGPPTPFGARRNRVPAVLPARSAVESSTAHATDLPVLHVVQITYSNIVQLNPTPLPDVFRNSVSPERRPAHSSVCESTAPPPDALSNVRPGRARRAGFGVLGRGCAPGSPGLRSASPAGGDRSSGDHRLQLHPSDPHHRGRHPAGDSGRSAVRGCRGVRLRRAVDRGTPGHLGDPAHSAVVPRFSRGGRHDHRIGVWTDRRAGRIRRPRSPERRQRSGWGWLDRRRNRGWRVWRTWRRQWRGSGRTHIWQPALRPSWRVFRGYTSRCPGWRRRGGRRARGIGCACPRGPRSRSGRERGHWRTRHGRTWLGWRLGRRPAAPRWARQHM